MSFYIYFADINLIRKDFGFLRFVRLTPAFLFYNGGFPFNSDFLDNFCKNYIILFFANRVSLGFYWLYSFGLLNR